MSTTINTINTITSTASDASASAIDAITIHQGHQGRFYRYKDIDYDIHFPIAHAMNHNPDANTANCGPGRCEKCDRLGYYNKVFVGYCGDCGDKYSTPRGCMSRPLGETRFITHYVIWNDSCIKEFLPYMLGVNRAEVGNYDVSSGLPTGEITSWCQPEVKQQEEEEDQPYEYDNYSDYSEQDQEPDWESWRGCDDDYYDEDEERQLEQELARCPPDMRAACDPRYRDAFEIFRDQMRSQR